MAGQPFVNYNRHKLLVTQSTTANIPNTGVTKLTALSTYTLDAPYPGALKTIVAVDRPLCGQCWFRSGV
jgi:hypothetical protein